MGFSRPENWSGLPFLSSGNLPHSGIEPVSPELWADSLLSESPGKAVDLFKIVLLKHLKTTGKEIANIK